MLSTLRNVFKLVYAKKSLPAPVRCLSVLSETGVIKSAVPDLDIPDTSIPDYVFQDFYKFPNKIALECALTGRNYTYEDVIVKSKNFSRALRKILKLSPGDIVATLLPNVPEYPICIHGCLMANIPVTTINPIYTPDEISKQLLDTDAKAIITLSALNSVAVAATKLIKKNIPIIAIKVQEGESLSEGSIDLFELFNTKIDIEDLPPAKPNDIAVIPYSSGTTGLPKGVPLTHKNIISNIIQSSHPNFRLHIDTTGDHQDVVPAILPFFHIFGLTALQCLNLSAMCKVVSLPKFAPELFLKVLMHYKPHTLIIVPSIMNLIANQPAVKKEYLKSVRTLFSGAAPLSAQDEEKLINKIGDDISVRQGYGLTETSPAVFMSSLQTVSLGVRGTVGEILPNTTVKLVATDNPNKTILSPNEPGELLVKGPQVMSGYFKRTNDSDVFSDGYFKTGDLLYYDKHNNFYVVDRLKELIKVKGFQVAPAELEGILRSHPDVLDAAVIGIPHTQCGEVPRAYLVPKPQHTINLDDIQKFVSNKVAKYKHLQGGVSIIDSLPKTLSGKIIRKELKAIYEKETKVA